jgi:RimJ/RimL family protein N-acetyltransferase
VKLEKIGTDRYFLIDDRLPDWIAARIDGMKADNLRRYAATLGVVIGGELVAAMAVGGKERGNVEITFAADSPKWATRDTIRRMMAWPFDQLDCHRVTTRIAASNKRAIRFNEGIGFRREGVIREGWGPGEDAVLLGLLRSEAPEWMRPQPALAATLEMA